MTLFSNLLHGYILYPYERIGDTYMIETIYSYLFKGIYIGLVFEIDEEASGDIAGIERTVSVISLFDADRDCLRYEYVYSAFGDMIFKQGATFYSKDEGDMCHTFVLLKSRERVYFNMTEGVLLVRIGFMVFDTPWMYCHVNDTDNDELMRYVSEVLSQERLMVNNR